MVTSMSVSSPPGMVAAKVADAYRAEKTRVRKKCIVMMISVYRLDEVKHGYRAEVIGYFALLFILSSRDASEEPALFVSKPYKSLVSNLAGNSRTMEVWDKAWKELIQLALGPNWICKST